MEVDECSKGTHECHKEAECTNNPGSYDCKCNEGFAGTGKHCTSDATFACPSAECWEMDKATGVCTPLPSAKDTCYLVACSHTSIDVAFKAALFGADFQFARTGDQDVDQKGQQSEDARSSTYITNLFNKNLPGIIPTYNADNSLWSFSCPLGGCGMTTTSADSGNSVAFRFRVENDQELLVFNDLILQYGKAEYKMDFECTYLTSVMVASDLTVGGATAISSVKEYHSLSAGFSINLFQDSEFKNDLESIYIGAPIFVQTKWEIQTLSSIIQYYIEYCTAEVLGHSIPLVKSNCYSDTLHAQLLSSAHLTSNVARFSFRSFSVGTSFEHVTKIRCGLRLCVTNPPSCQINEKESDCPKTDNGIFQFTPRGKQ